MTSRRWSRSGSLIGLAASVPWRISIALAALSFVVLRIPGAVEILKWLLPIAFLLLAGASILRRPQRVTLQHETMAAAESQLKLPPMPWEEFEKLVTGYLHRRGFVVTERGAVREDGAVDMWLMKDEEYFMLQCRHWRDETVGIEVVSELSRALAARHAAGGLIVTSGSFTPGAKAFAEDRTIELIDGERLAAEAKAQARDARRAV